jgi:hypothetical protein
VCFVEGGGNKKKLEIIKLKWNRGGTTGEGVGVGSGSGGVAVVPIDSA